MKLVILDGYTCNPGDLSWGPLERFGPVTAYDVTEPHQVVERCAGFDIVISNKTLLPRPTLEQLADVRYIGLLSTGYNVVDVTAAAELGITVSFVPGYSTAAVAQHTIALLLELCNHVGVHADAVHAGRWEACRRFCFWETPLTELAGKTLGVLGMGSIGTAVAGIATALGMRVIYHSRTQKPALPYEYVTADDLFARSDVLTIHCPLTDATRGMVNARTLALMKPTAMLINTARGDVIDEAALAHALEKGALAGAALDVLCTEPPAGDHVLLHAPRCLITPHLAWAAKETRQRLIQMAADNLEAFVQGHPVNIAT